MVAASIGAFFVDRAAAGLRIQITAIVIGAPCQREDAVLEIKMLNDAGFHQAFGDLLGRFSRFEFVYLAHPHQIGQFHFHRHGAAGTHTLLAHACAVL